MLTVPNPVVGVEPVDAEAPIDDPNHQQVPHKNIRV